MSLRRLALVLLATAAAVLVASFPASAKEGVKATLITEIPVDAAPGTKLTLSWRLFSVDEARRDPFGANGVYIRLLSATGAKATDGVAPTGDYLSGEYEATVVVPVGGIGGVEIGLMGWQSDAQGTRRADAMFPITNDPVPGTPRAATPTARSTAADGSSGNSLTWVFVAAGGVLVATAALALAIYRRRRGAAAARDRDFRPAPSSGASSKA